MNDPDVLADLLLSAYRAGLFPMADDAADADFYWVEPRLRGQLPILDLHIPGRLGRTVLAAPYRVSVDTAFDAVIAGCSESVPGRAQTWINGPIADAFKVLHARGMAHSVEVWGRIGVTPAQAGVHRPNFLDSGLRRNDKKEGRNDEKEGRDDGKAENSERGAENGERGTGNNVEREVLVGGLYGLALGGVFCGESMFSRARDASKIALVHLCARLWRAGFTVLDTQFVNDHLRQFGVFEIPQADYLRRLHRALPLAPDFRLAGDPLAGSEPDLLIAYLSARGAPQPPAPAPAGAAD